MPNKKTSKGSPSVAKARSEPPPAQPRGAQAVAQPPAPAPAPRVEARTPSTPPARASSEPPDAPAKKKSGSAELAAQLAAGTAEPGVVHYARALEDSNPNTASQAARVLEELVGLKPELCAPHIERFVRLLLSEQARVVQASAHALPLLARVAPAKVARHLEKLRGSYDQASEVAREGMVKTFVALCVASVAYQKRVVDVLEKALASAEPKTLVRWTELVLPALKGEPHAQARAVVEQRLAEIPRPQAEKIAEFLGIRLRPSRAP